MADIIQAAKWMREGRRVCISTWSEVSLGLKSGSPEELVLFDHRDGDREMKYMAYLFDLCSNDWELSSVQADCEG